MKPASNLEVHALGDFRESMTYVKQEEKALQTSTRTLEHIIALWHLCPVMAYAKAKGNVDL
jgi:hypothetical protein